MPELKHNLRVEPYPYQRDGILFGLQKKRLIIGDEPGLGKLCRALVLPTAQTLTPAWLSARPLSR